MLNKVGLYLVCNRILLAFIHMTVDGATVTHVSNWFASTAERPDVDNRAHADPVHDNADAELGGHYPTTLTYASVLDGTAKAGGAVSDGGRVLRPLVIDAIGMRNIHGGILARLGAFKYGVLGVRELDAQKGNHSRWLVFALQ